VLRVRASAASQDGCSEQFWQWGSTETLDLESVSSTLSSAKRPSRAVPPSRPVREKQQEAPAGRKRERLLIGLCRKGWSGGADLRIGQRSLQLVVEVHGFLQGLAVYKVTWSEVTKLKAVCQATLREANICA
jgi:hypothetical protein